MLLVARRELESPDLFSPLGGLGNVRTVGARQKDRSGGQEWKYVPLSRSLGRLLLRG